MIHYSATVMPALTAWLALVVLTATNTAQCEPYMGISQGMTCAQCHVNGSGGGMRTDFGHAFSFSILPQPGQDVQPSIELRNQTGFKIGLDLRFETIFRFEEESDSGNQEGSVNHRIPTGNAYAELELLKNYMSVYVDGKFAPNPGTREAYLAMKPMHGQIAVKAGRLLPAFTWAVQDDEAFTRRISQSKFSNARDGLALEWKRPYLYAQTAFLDTRATVHFEYVTPLKSIVSGPRIGGSAYRDYRNLWQLGNEVSKGNALDSATYGIGGFGGFQFWRLSVLGEIDWHRSIESGAGIWQRHGLLETSLMLTQGLYFRFWFDWLHPDTRVDFEHNAKSRTSVGLAWFHLPFLELSAYYTVRESIPQDSEGGQDWLRLQMHAYY